MLLFGSPFALADSRPNQIALAISGGASMGAYEAGLIWGLIEVIHEVEQSGHWSLGGEPRPIEIASIAGTSAGGINSLLAALTWSVKPQSEGGFANRIDDNIFRDVWLTPDVNSLLPPTPDSPLYSDDDALLSRQDLVEVSRALREKWRKPGTFRPGVRLPLGVTVTRVQPEVIYISGIEVKNQRFYLPFELQIQADGSATFYFNPADYPSMGEPAMILMPWSEGTQDFFITDQQVEDAIVTTSAFPLGFGRKRLPYCRQKKLGRKDGQTAAETKTPFIADNETLMCPEGYELAEAEFADGGLFDNLPIGLARLLAESSSRYKEAPLPVNYLYLDPDRKRYQSRPSQGKTACEGENPPEACRQMTFNLASESVVLGGAIGTARNFELYRELTSDNWRLNLAALSRRVADLVDDFEPEPQCDADLPYFDRQLGCSDRLRYTGRLLELTHSYRMVPITEPLSPKALLQEDIASTCRPPTATDKQGFAAECMIDLLSLRKKVAQVLERLSGLSTVGSARLQADVRRSALTINADRYIRVASRGGPITGELLGYFGAFFDYKFREFDFYVGVYDAIIVIAQGQCERNFPVESQRTQFLACRDRLSEQLYQQVGVDQNPKSRYVFARMAEQEFGPTGGLRDAYDPMPTEDRDMRIIFDGLNHSAIDQTADKSELEGFLTTERRFFEHLKAEQFEPTPPRDGGKPLLALIMKDPDYWASELVNRGTNRLMYLEKLAEAVYRAREPDPQKREKTHTTLMGAGALALRTATYKYPEFAFAPSTAPESWLWRNIIPYETAFDLNKGDLLFFWQPTWSYKHVNVGIRFGLGFASGAFSADNNAGRQDYGVLGLDLTRDVPLSIFSGWGITPAVYHSWRNPDVGDQTTFGFDVHANLFNNRVRLSLGTSDLIHHSSNKFFILVGIADLPGLAYWLSR